MADKLEALVEGYIQTGLELKKVPRKRPLYTRLTGRYNPDLHWLCDSFTHDRDRVRQIYQIIDNEKDEKKVIDTVRYARRISHSNESGMLTGFLLPEDNIQIRDNLFDSGLNQGQILGMKARTAKVQGILTRGYFVTGLGLALQSVLNSHPDSQSISGKASDYILTGAALAGVYGIYPMVRHNLFGNDINPSKELITDGVYSMHRNPFYAGMFAALSLADISFLLQNLSNQNPNWIPLALITGGIATIMHAQYKYTLKDEKILEKQFGEAYRDYKSRTPRYFPNPFNLFRRNK